MRALNNDKEILALAARVMRKLAMASVFLYCYMATVAEPLMVLLWTDKFRGSAPIFFINSTLILAAILPVDPLTRIYPEYRFFFVKFRIVLVAAMALALWKITPEYGPSSAITIFIATAIFDKLFTAGVFVKVLKMQRTDLWQFRDTLKILMCGTVAALSSLAMLQQTAVWKPFYVLLATGIVFSIVYTTMFLVLKIPNNDERQLIRKVLPGPLKQMFV